MTLFAAFCIPGIILTMIGICDSRSMRIPFVLNLWFLISSLGVRTALFISMAGEISEASLARIGDETTDILLGMILGMGLMVSAAFILRGRGIGGADIRLVTYSGILLGDEYVMKALMLACLLAIPEAVIRRRAGRKSFPLGPYLSFGIMTVWIFRLHVIRGYI